MPLTTANPEDADIRRWFDGLVEERRIRGAALKVVGWYAVIPATLPLSEASTVPFEQSDGAISNGCCTSETAVDFALARTAVQGRQDSFANNEC
ncbi:hypothetical protein B0G81_1600 [Paraburkholderia sp. BL6665CI2N2]|uniref:hypothetical protein n=1 Tax=Paraburkholderia sp. BL6665CI2N2 TaxID=1938806 RepID=UPI0010F3ECDA|nr:hypothetical protein [Paraburkholderia sp. BL6665CI2N2]TDY21397.1 hypothetical protein B0G81_1600 [Paraburkholderia sp. BL6665CI2N2]